MKERIIKHWITTLFGLIIMIAAAILFILGRLGSWEMIPAILIGFALFHSKDSWIKSIFRYVFIKNSDNIEVDQTYSNKDNEQG